MRRHRLVISGYEDRAVMRMPEGMDLDQRRLHIARDQRVAHPRMRLHHPVADIRRVKDAGLATRLEDTVGDLIDQGLEMEGAGMPHPVRTLHEDLGLAQIFLGPVHAQSQGITLMVHRPQPLAPQLTHCRSPSPWNRWSHAPIGIYAPGRDVAPMVRASRFHGAPLWTLAWEDRSATHPRGVPSPKQQVSLTRS